MLQHMNKTAYQIYVEKQYDILDLYISLLKSEIVFSKTKSARNFNKHTD